MILFKLSWLPYILILAGILVAIDGDPAALILVVIGVIWLFFRFKKKREEKASNNPNTSSTSYNANTSSTPYAAPNAPHATHIVSESASPVDASNPAAKFCSNCGAKATPGSVFCSNCGNKL